MTEELLDGEDVDVVFEEVRGERAPERVQRHTAPADAGGVSDAFLAEGNYELVVANEAFPARIVLEPLYDPTNARVKG